MLNYSNAVFFPGWILLNGKTCSAEYLGVFGYAGFYSLWAQNQIRARSYIDLKEERGPSFIHADFWEKHGHILNSKPIVDCVPHKTFYLKIWYGALHLNCKFKFVLQSNTLKQTNRKQDEISYCHTPCLWDTQSQSGKSPFHEEEDLKGGQDTNHPTVSLLGLPKLPWQLPVSRKHELMLVTHGT